MRLTYFCISRIYLYPKIMCNPVCLYRILDSKHITVAKIFHCFDRRSARFLAYFAPDGIIYFFTKFYATSGNWLPRALFVATPL